MLHTDVPTGEQIDDLLRVRSSAAVSIHLPTTPVTTEVDHDRLALRNLADEAVSQLRDRGVRA